jgi:hypothetical protein
MAGGGLCDSNPGALFWQVLAGSGGPSGCAMGQRDLRTAAAVSGDCLGYVKPRWQTGIAGNPADGVRDIPDVSLFAGDGAWLHQYVFCSSGTAGTACAGQLRTWPQGGGTSFAAAIMAGVQALIDQKKNGRQGNPAPVFYALARKQEGGVDSAGCNSNLGGNTAPGCIFHDIVQGDMGVNCTSATDLGPKAVDDGEPVNCFMNGNFMGVLSISTLQMVIGYPAAPGWDFATGLGSVDASNLVSAWP